MVPEGSLAGFAWCHEVALELVCGADVWCSLHFKTSPMVLDGFWGNIWPKPDRTPTRTFPARLLSGTQFVCSSVVYVCSPQSFIKQVSAVLIADPTCLACVLQLQCRSINISSCSRCTGNHHRCLCSIIPARALPTRARLMLSSRTSKITMLISCQCSTDGTLLALDFVDFVEGG